MQLFNSFVASTVALCASSVFAHNHVTVDTASGTPGDQIIIRVGYQPSESAYSIVNGILLFNSAPVVYDISEEIEQPGYEGWIGGDELVLTSDFYFGTGRLDGGDFHFEIVGVTQITTGGAPIQFVWGESHTKGLEFTANSAGATRIDRSFHVGNGEHGHGQVFAISQPGTYDITLIAWDANAVYTDSESVTFRISTPPPSCPGDTNGDHVINGADLSVLLATFGQSVAPGSGADFNADGTVNGADLSVLLSSFGSSC